VALVHTSETGSLDKVVLEALACGTPVITTSHALGDVPTTVARADPEGLAKALGELPAPNARYAEYVRHAHALTTLIPRILAVCAERVERQAKRGKTMLITTGLYPPEIGGPATHAAMLERELPKRGWEVSVLPFAEVRHLPKVARHLVYFFKCVARARLWRARALYAFDAVSVGFPTLLAARLLRKDFFLRLGGDYAWEQGRLRFGVTDSLDEFARVRGGRYHPMVRLLRRMQSFVARRACRIAVQSAHMRRVVQCWGVPAERVVVIPNGFDAPPGISSKQSAREALGIRGSTVVSAGRLVPWKGFAGLIEAMPAIVSSVPEATLYIVGDGPEEGRLRQLVRECGLSDCVVFVGRLDRAGLMRYLVAADVFALNSEYEGFSHQLLEAYAAGTPVVATDIAGNEGVVEHGESGLLVSPRDGEALAAGIAQALTDHPLARLLVKGGTQKLREFRTERVAVATEVFLA
jgi:glycosyltransferase involved in cell wall biosynthesis